MKEDTYKGDPPEIAGVPVFPQVGFAQYPDKSPYPSVPTQETRHEGTIREFCAELASGPTWAEFGVLFGVSARYFLTHLPEDGTLYLFDSFEGLPEAWGDHHKGWFNIKAPGHPWKIPTFTDPRIIVKEGWFEDTLPIDAIFDFVHIDSDLYSSAKTILDRINVRPGTIILFDELHGYKGWEGHEYKALMEWDRDWKFIARDEYTRAAIEIL